MIVLSHRFNSSWESTDYGHEFTRIFTIVLRHESHKPWPRSRAVEQ